MAYSRWITSRWYTYWLASNARTRLEQVFVVDGVSSVSYGEMLKNFDATLDKIVANADAVHVAGTTVKEKTELARYMRAFMTDVEKTVPAIEKEEEVRHAPEGTLDYRADVQQLSLPGLPVS